MSLAGLLASGRTIDTALSAFLPGRIGASGFVRTQTGNSGATAADSHRFPFSPDSKPQFLGLRVEHRGRFI